jgi:endonuclease YncB( thermonuclease family)
MSNRIVEIQKQIGTLIDKVIHEAKTSEKCEAYCFWEGVTVFVRTVNDTDSVRCSVNNKVTFQVVVESHRPHRIRLSLTSTPEGHQVKFGQTRTSKWEISEEVEPHVESYEYTSKYTEIFDEDLYRVGEEGTESITTNIKRTAPTPSGDKKDQAQETIRLTLI